MPEWAWLIDRALADRLTRGGGFRDEEARSAARQFVDLLAEKA
jgi:hypothetical protein